MRITSVTVENWKSFGPAQTVPLGGLTLLIGPNGSGKTSFLSALEALAAATHGAPTRLSCLRAAGATRLDGRGPSRLTFQAAGDDDTVAYSLSVEETPAPRLTERRRRGDAVLEIQRHATDSLFAVDVPRSVVTDLRSFAVWRPELPRVGGPHELQRCVQLGHDGVNAASLLDSFDPESDEWRRLQDDVRRCAPEVRRVVTEPTHSGHKQIVVVERGGARVPCSLTSDGFKMLLFVLLILHSPDRPRFLAIEEIEHGLHPRRVADVIHALRQLTRMPEEPQIIITSHSPLVLDMFRDTPVDVVVFERGEDGCTVCTPLETRLDDIPSGTDGVSLGELWYSGVLGGVPAS